MHAQLQDDPLLNAKKKKNNQKLQKWKLRGKEKPIWEFYDPEAELGSGAFGTVQRWRLKQVAPDEDPYVAVKHIRWSDISGGIFRSQEAEKVVRSELKMLLVLDHPFIVKFREWFSPGDNETLTPPPGALATSKGQVRRVLVIYTDCSLSLSLSPPSSSPLPSPSSHNPPPSSLRPPLSSLLLPPFSVSLSPFKHRCTRGPPCQS